MLDLELVSSVEYKFLLEYPMNHSSIDSWDIVFTENVTDEKMKVIDY